MFFVHPNKSNLLTHKVLPIGSRTMSCLFDYGALGPDVEKKYIKAILNKFPVDIKNEVDLKKILTESIVESQKFIREIVEENMSSVSLRDIKRVQKIFNFYSFYIMYKNKAMEHYENFPNGKNIFLKFVIILRV